MIKTTPEITAIVEKMTPKTVFKIGDSDLERLVSLTLGQNWSFVADQECGNDSEHSIDVDGEEFEPDTIEDFKGGDHGCYIADELMNYLASEDVIPKGEYIVSVCW